LVLSPTGLIYLGFITEGRLAAVLITPSLGVPNWSVIYIINTTPSDSTAISIDSTAISIDIAVSYDEEGVVLPRG
jgi:hypothetical protein